MAEVAVAAGEFVFPTGLVRYNGGHISIVDNSGGPNNGHGGDGYYTLSINSSGVIIVTKGAPPAQSATLQHLANVHVSAGVARIADRRSLNVTALAVNKTIMHTANADGSYLVDGAVTERALSAAVQAAIAAGLSPPTVAIEDCIDIDHTTETTGYLLAFVASSGKPFSFVAPSTPKSCPAYLGLLTDDALDPLLTDGAEDELLVAVQLYGGIT